MVSFRAGGSRVAEASPMISGAIVMMPSASDANQFCQVTKLDAGAPWNKAKPRVPPIPETAVAMIAAPSRPSTWRSRPRLKGDQAGCQQGFPRIAYGEDHGAQEVPIAQEIGHDGRDHCPGHDRPSRMRAKSDQRARGNAGGRPEHGHAVGSEQGKAKLCREDIDAANHNGEPTQAHPSPRGVARVRSLGLHSQILQHVAVSDGLTQSPRLRGRAASRAWAVGPSRASGLR